MRRVIAIVLLSFAFLQLGFRGMQRVKSEVPLWDFASVYAATQTWIHGGNPYDTALVVKTWKDTGLFSDRDVSYFATVYPPCSLLMLVPFAALPAGVAMLAWQTVTILLLAFQFAGLLDMAGLRWDEPRALLLLGASLASAAFQFGLLSGQLSIPAISLCIIAFWSAFHRRDVLAGVLLGLACALKPQIGGPFVLYYLAMRRWNIGAFAGGVGGVLLVASLVGMKVCHIDWLNGWTASIAVTGQIGGVNDYGWTGFFRDEILDLKIVLVSFIHNAQLLRLAVEGIFIAMAVWYWRVFPRTSHRTGRDELLILAGLSALALLPIYHRVYDAALLTTALAWALAELDGERRRYAIALLTPMSLFLIPFDVVKSVAQHLHKAEPIVRSGFWQTWIAPHYAWGLLGVTIALMWTMGRGFSKAAPRFSSDGEAEKRSIVSVEI